MRKVPFKCDHEVLEIEGENNFHINKVEVFTGDDDYNETDTLELSSENSELKVKRIINTGLALRKSTYRLRNEPGVRVYLEDENEGKFLLSISHHKGGVYINMKKTNGNDGFDASPGDIE